MLTSPCRHLVIDNFLDKRTALAIADAFPGFEWPHWLNYLSNDQYKKTCNIPYFIPPDVVMGIKRLLSFPAGEALEIGPLEADHSLYGGGMHSMARGGRLGVHLDCDRHPITGLERRVNAIYFTTVDWNPAWGGALTLTNEDDSHEVTISPQFNRLVLFETTDSSWHGIPDPIQCPSNVARNTLAVYYWGQPTKESVRPKAKFK